MFCTKCGSKLDDSAKFCTVCGTPTNSNQAEPQAAPAKAQEKPSPQPVIQEQQVKQATQEKPVIQQPVGQQAAGQPAQKGPAFQQPGIPHANQPVQQGPVFPQQPIQQGMPPLQHGQMMGGPLPPQAPKQPASVPKKKEKNKKKIILIAGICAAIIAIGGGTGYFLYQNNIKKQAKNVIAYFEEGNYDKAIDIFEKYSGKKKFFDEKVKEELLKKAELIKENYLAESLDYKLAKEQLNNLEEYDIDELTDVVGEVRAFVDKIYQSREYYKEGKASFDIGDYSGAIMYYEAVSKDDAKYYDLARKEIEKAQLEEEKLREEERLSGLKEQAITDAEYYAYNRDYANAILAIEQGLSELPGDQDLTDILAGYKLLQELTLKVPSISSSHYDYTYTEDGIDYMTLTIDVPHLEGDSPIYASINEAFEAVKDNLITYGDSMANIAKEFVYDEFFYAYSLELGFSVKYNQNGILCVLLEGYEYTGGAHGYPIRQVMTFDLANGWQLSLDDLIAADEETFGSYVMAEFDRMYNAGDVYYWDNAYELVEYSIWDFSRMNYYITENEIIIFFYPYELASYADGFVDIVFPYAGNEWMFEYLQ